MNFLHRLTRPVARFAQRWRAHAGLIQAFFATLAFALGLWGWFLHTPPADLSGHLNNLFRTLQLITLQFPTQFDGQLPWQLHVARLMVPLAALAASLHIVIGAATRPARLALMPTARNHIIICGAEQLTESALRKLAEQGDRQIVTLGPPMDPGRREALEGLGLTIVEGDAREPATLPAIGAANAAALFITGEDDVANLNIAMLAISATRARKPGLPPLSLAVLVDREELASELDSALDGLSRAAGLRYHRLCPDREGLRLELARHAPVFRKQNLDARTHLLVLGLAGRWQQSLMQLVTAAQDHPTERPLLTLVLAPEEMAALAEWRHARPELELVAEFAVLPSGHALLPPAETLADWRAAHAAPQLAIVLRPDAEALGTALALRRPGCALGVDAATPILVRQSREDHLLAALGGAGIEQERLGGLIAFGGLLRAESIARVLDRTGEATAIAMHAAYQEATKTLPPGSPESIAAWDALSENLRDANRAAAEHVPILLAAVGLRAGDAANDETIERMARIEHRRWIADRLDRGWRYAPIRDNAQLLHPSMLDYDALPEMEREKDRNQVRTILGLLAPR
jgi:hypothetical protein